MTIIKNQLLKIKSYIHYPYFLGLTLFLLVKIFKIKSQADELEPSSIIPNHDTMFILGSGYSINSISQPEWEKMCKNGDTMSLNFFFMGKFIPINFHVVREISPYYSLKQFAGSIHQYFSLLGDNHYYSKTIFLIRFDPISYASTLATFFYKALKNKKICYYANGLDISNIELPTNSFKKIPHCGATLIDAINIAFILGYTNIVLVGVDLYDRRYFWLQENQTRDGDNKRCKTYRDEHNTASTVIDTMKIWYPYLLSKGVKIYIYNPKSLLADIIPVFSFNKKKT
nr:hypothetical protein [uncultured Methanospirillum sp.]